MNKPVPRLCASLMIVCAVGCARHSGDVGSLGLGSPPAFETRVEIETGSDNHSDYRVADFDGDGVLDMAIISLTGELRVLLGNGADFVLVQQLQIDGLPIGLDGGDFDGDGDEDLVVVRSAANETNVYGNDGNGEFSLGGTLVAGEGALSLAVGDINGDGLLDVVVSRPEVPEVLLGFGDGQLGFGSQQALALPGGGTAFNVAIGDATRDGQTDLVVADTGRSRLVVYSGTTGGGGIGAELCELQIPGTPGAVTFGDLSGDGLEDLVVSAFSNNHYVVVTEIFAPGLPSPGPGSSGVPVCDFLSFDVPVSAPASLAKVGDVTGDGVNDLVACLGFHASVCVVPGLQSGGVGAEFVLDSTGLPLRPFIGDFDNDGTNDVFALSGLGNRVNLWISRASGSLAGARSYASGLSGASWMDGGDFDGDGDSELIVSSASDMQLSILGGSNALEIEGIIEVGLTIRQIRAADLDLDGDLDLVIGVPGGVKVLRNSSTPGDYSLDLMPVSPATVGSSNYPFGVTFGDFDRDGDIDIVVCDYVGGSLHLVPGTSEPFVYEPEIIITVGGGPVDVVSADFTGDGLQDLAVSRSGQADIAILRNEGSNQFVESFAIPVGESPNYLVTADFNNDGRSDLVVSNAVSGSVSVLFGTSTGFVGNDFAAGASPTALLARDLTNDGFVDILVASLVSGDFRVLVGDGSGGFPLLPSYPGTLGASDAVLQDMTGDGVPDLMVSSLISNRVSLVVNIPQ